MNPRKENHHYIPKFYLRNFSYQGNKKQIGIFNTRTGFFHAQGKLKSQAYKTYLYGRDNELEDALSELESMAAIMLRDVISKRFLPAANTIAHRNLLYFVLLTDLRNPFAVTTMSEQLNEMFKHTMGRDVRFKDFFKKYKFDFGSEYLLLMALSHINSGLLQCEDLEFKLVVNQTSVPFIINDRPLLRYNQFMEERKWFAGQTGFSSRGLQLFLPLDPKHLLLFYDSKIYKVGSRSDKIIVTGNDKDVNSINLLNYLSCDEMIFFNHEVKEYYIRRLLQESLKFQKANQPTTLTFPTPERPGEKDSMIVMTSSTDCKIGLQLSFVKFTKAAKKMELDNHVVQLRDSYWKIKPELEQLRNRIRPMNQTHNTDLNFDVKA